MDQKLLKDIKLSQTHDLADDEKRVSHFIEEYLIDEHGLLYSHLNANTLKPWTLTQFQNNGYQLHFYNMERGDPMAVLTYEDSLMATGEYALSQIIKYEVTGDATALTTAAHPIYAILRVLYEGENYEKGYLPKPHGGLRKAAYSHEISPDQYIKSYVALRAYQQHSPTSLRRTIDSYLVAIANYHLARNFVHPRRESTIVTPENALHSVSIYIPSLVVAHKITGEKKYKDALRRFDSVLDSLLQGKAEVDFNICSLLVEGFHLALEEGFQEPRLPKIIKKLWEMNIELVSDDGLGYQRHELPVKTSRVLRLPSLAPIVDQYCPGAKAFKLGLFILKKITNPNLMLYVNDSDPNPKYVPLERRYVKESICETSVTSWLLGYWRLKKSLEKQ